MTGHRWPVPPLQALGQLAALKDDPDVSDVLLGLCEGGARDVIAALDEVGGLDAKAVLCLVMGASFEHSEVSAPAALVLSILAAKVLDGEPLDDEA